MNFENQVAPKVGPLERSELTDPFERAPDWLTRLERDRQSPTQGKVDEVSRRALSASALGGVLLSGVAIACAPDAVAVGVAGVCMLATLAAGAANAGQKSVAQVIERWSAGRASPARLIEPAPLGELSRWRALREASDPQPQIGPREVAKLG